MPAELNQLETALLALGASLAMAAFLVLGFWAMKTLRKWFLSQVILMIRSK